MENPNADEIAKDGLRVMRAFMELDSADRMKVIALAEKLSSNRLKVAAPS